MSKPGVRIIEELSTEAFTAEEIRDFRTYFVEKRISLRRKREEINQELTRIDNLITKLNA